jgi:hypothetical protein
MQNHKYENIILGLWTLAKKGEGEPLIRCTSYPGSAFEERLSKDGFVYTYDGGIVISYEVQNGYNQEETLASRIWSFYLENKAINEKKAAL